jgi:hypothetical protein
VVEFRDAAGNVALSLCVPILLKLPQVFVLITSSQLRSQVHELTGVQLGTRGAWPRTPQSWRKRAAMKQA